MGPSSSSPEEGEGIEATSELTRGILPTMPVACSGRRLRTCRSRRRRARDGPEVLEEDRPGELGRTAALDELDGPMEVDVRAGRELRGHGGRVPGAQQLLAAPALDALDLRPVLCLCRGHV